MENGTTVFHVSIHADERLSLNYTHEYQIVWIEPDDGSHVWDIQVGESSQPHVSNFFCSTLRLREPYEEVKIRHAVLRSYQ